MERCLCVCVCVALQGEVGGPGQKGSKGDKGELVSLFFSIPFYVTVSYGAIRFKL